MAGPNDILSTVKDTITSQLTAPVPSMSPTPGAGGSDKKDEAGHDESNDQMMQMVKELSETVAKLNSAITKALLSVMGNLGGAVLGEPGLAGAAKETGKDKDQSKDQSNPMSSIDPTAALSGGADPTSLVSGSAPQGGGGQQPMASLSPMNLDSVTSSLTMFSSGDLGGYGKTADKHNNQQLANQAVDFVAKNPEVLAAL